MTPRNLSEIGKTVLEAKGIESLESPWQSLASLKTDLIAHIERMKGILNSTPNDQNAQKDLASIREIVEKLKNIKNRNWKEKSETVITSRLDRLNLNEHLEMREIYIETQEKLAELEKSVVDQKLANGGWGTLHVHEKIAILSDFDMAGGVQEYNKTEAKEEENYDIFWPKKMETVRSQKFIIGEKDLERTLSRIAKNEGDLNTIIARINGKPISDLNDPKKIVEVQKAFITNLLSRVDVLMKATRAVGSEYESGMMSVLLWKEGTHLEEMIRKKGIKTAEDAQKIVDAYVVQGLDGDAILKNLKAMGLNLALGQIGLSISASEKKAGTRGPLEYTAPLEGDVDGKMKSDGTVQIGGKIYPFMLSAEGQFNWNDKNEEARKVREQFSTSIDDLFKNSFNTDGTINVLKMKQFLESQKGVEGNLLSGLEDATKRYNEILTSFSTPESKQLYLNAIKNHWIEWGVAEYVKKNSKDKFEIKGLTVSLFLFIIPTYIGVSFQKLENVMRQGKENVGTRAETHSKTTTLEALWIKATETKEWKRYYELSNLDYSDVSVSEAGREAGISFDWKTGIISVPEKVELGARRILNANTGKYALELGAWKTTKTTKTTTTEWKTEKWVALISSQTLDSLIHSPKIRLALSDLSVGPTREKARNFSKEYENSDRRDPGDLWRLKKMTVSLLQSSLTSPKEMKALAKKLNDEEGFTKIWSIIDSVRYGMMTDRADAKFAGKKEASLRQRKMLHAKSPLSDKSFQDALNTVQSALKVDDFTDVVPTSGHKDGNAYPKMIAMVGTWKLDASMTYMSPGTVNIATENWKELKKDVTDPSKKTAMYDMLERNVMFKKYELKAVSDKVKEMTEFKWEISPDELKKIILWEKVTINGKMVEMENKYCFLAYGACANPSIGLELWQITVTTPGGTSTHEEVATMGITDETTAVAGQIDSTTKEWGIWVGVKNLFGRNNTASGGKTDIFGNPVGGGAGSNTANLGANLPGGVAGAN